MEGKMIVPEAVTRFEILNGDYSTAEALALVNRLLDHEFKYYKVKFIDESYERRFETWKEPRFKMAAFLQQKLEMKKRLKFARDQGFDVKIEGVVTVRLVKKKA